MIGFAFAILATFTTTADQEWIKVSADRTGFTLERSGRPFTPWGFNYDHDESGRLLEDYWENEWPKVEADFHEMKELGANVIRVHPQLGKFLDASDRPNRKSLDRLGQLLALAEKEGLYLDLTGLGCYHKKDVPVWYDSLSETSRWAAQATFWSAIAEKCRDSPAVFCYDLMNEPVVPGGRSTSGDWLGPAFGGKHFVQFVTLDQANRPRPEIARKWIKTLSEAIRKQDQRHLITVGLVDWSLDRPGLSSGFVPSKIADSLDFLCVHLYPEAGKLAEAITTLKGFSVGKPVVIEETFPLKCTAEEFARFLGESRGPASGWIGFYWGKNLDELRVSKTIPDALMAGWLDIFRKGPPGAP